jgi:23S rRNA (cytidine2498-2'-O)-methyltransferase
MAAMSTAYLAAEGHEERLAAELGRAGVEVSATHGRLSITDVGPIDAAWAANTWYDTRRLPIESIGDAANRLRAIQRSWAMYAPVHRGRASLIAEKLPPLSARPLDLGQLAPSSPLGSWTLLEPDLMLAADRCSSPFANGEVPLAELKVGPPNRAYRKLWEAFVVLGRFPARGDRAVDLGASPGGWTWLLAELGCRVVAVDKAPLDPMVAAFEAVSAVQASAFGLSPAEVFEGRPPEWVCADIACYPERLLPLIDRWTALAPPPTLIFTVKFQGETDHDITDRMRAIRGARVTHLHHNKHELTLIIDG